MGKHNHTKQKPPCLARDRAVSYVSNCVALNLVRDFVGIERHAHGEVHAFLLRERVEPDEEFLDVLLGHTGHHFHEVVDKDMGDVVVAGVQTAEQTLEELHRADGIVAREDEARLTFLAARRWYGWDAGRLLMIDIGGGSLEVALGSDEEPTIAAAVNAGAGVVTRDLLPGGMASPKDLESIHKKVRKMIAPVVDAVPAEDYSSHAVGTSKAIRSLARLAGTVIHQPGREDALCVERGQLEDWIPRLAAIEPAQRVALPGITQDRAMTIVGAGIIAVEIMRALGINEIEVCPWALREGAILRWLDQYGRTRFGF